MNLQERIDFILLKDFPATVKRKHLVYLMQHLGDYSENADELGEAHATICEALEQLDMEIGGNDTINFRMIPRGSGKIAYTEQLIKQQMEGKQPLTVTELDSTLEFFLTYNILSMQQVQEIRTKSAAYLR